MALKKPLVMTNGQIEQLQAGDTVEHPSLRNKTNNSGGALVFGTPVYVDGANTVDAAQANALSTSKVLGLVAEASIADTDPGAIQTDGFIEGTTGQWDAVTGDVGGLTPGATYWLDPDTAGMITTTAPTSTGDVVAPLGTACSTTELEIEVGQTVRL